MFDTWNSKLRCSVDLRNDISAALHVKLWKQVKFFLEMIYYQQLRHMTTKKVRDKCDATF